MRTINLQSDTIFRSNEKFFVVVAFEVDGTAVKNVAFFVQGNEDGDTFSRRVRARSGLRLITASCRRGGVIPCGSITLHSLGSYRKDQIELFKLNLVRLHV